MAVDALPGSRRGRRRTASSRRAGSAILTHQVELRAGRGWRDGVCVTGSAFATDLMLSDAPQGWTDAGNQPGTGHQPGGAGVQYSL